MRKTYSSEVIDNKINGFEWQAPVLNILNTPPDNPTKGDRYLIGTSPTGAWSGKSNYIAYWDGSSWIFIAPKEGMVLYNKNDKYFYEYKSSTWGKVEVEGEGQQVLQPLWFLIY